MSSTVLVTGATGFMGGHLVRRLSSTGARVEILSRPDSRTASLDDLGDRIGRHVHDGTTEGMHAILAATRPRTIYHTASLFIAEHQTHQVTNLIEANVLFSTQLADAAAAAGVRNFINVGTSWQHYGDADYEPSCLYAATKQAFESILTFYASTAGLRVATMIVFDTYGPGDTRPKLLQLLRRVALSGEHLGMSPGEQSLDLVHIDDVIDALLAAADWAERTAAPGAMERFGIFSGEVVTVRELVAMVGDILGRTLDITWGGRPYRKREIMTPYAHAHPVPGWRAKTPLREGLRRTLNADA